MYLVSRPLYLVAESSIHAGSDRELGIVDLPIQREVHTGFPKIESSGVKGCIRETLSSILEKERLKYIFGPEPDGENKNISAGLISFSDARLLLFPVRSFKGVYALITCPMVLHRWKSIVPQVHLIINDSINNNSALVSQNSPLLFKSKVILEETVLDAQEDGDITRLGKEFASILYGTQDDYFKKMVENNLVVLSDEMFALFVSTSTEVIARTKIDSKTGTAAKGALWYEEYLPSESVLYSMVMMAAVESNNHSPLEKQAKENLNLIKRKLPGFFQIGGNATIGKGLVRAIWGEEVNNDK